MSLSEISVRCTKSDRDEGGRDQLSGLKNLLEIRERSRIVRLPKPEDGFLADGGIRVCLRHLEQLRDCLVFGQLAQRKYRFLLDGELGIVRALS